MRPVVYVLLVALFVATAASFIVGHYAAFAVHGIILFAVTLWVGLDRYLRVDY